MKAMLSTLIMSATIALGAAPAMAQVQAAPDGEPTARPDTAAAPDQCLRIGNIWDYAPVPGNRALIVTDKTRRKYKLTFSGTCTGLEYHTGLKFHSRGFGRLSCLAPGDSVITHDVAGPPTCTISSVTPYTAQMEKADAKARAEAEKAEQADK